MKGSPDAPGPRVPPAGGSPRGGLRLALGVLLATAGGCIIGEHPFWNRIPVEGSTGGGGSAGTSAGSGTTATTSGATSTATATATTSPGSSTEPGTTGPPSTMGQACAEDLDCDDGQTCCQETNCLNTCLILCGIDPAVCPDGMSCLHGYCLLDCSTDGECSAWPGFTCQHMGTACENGDEGTGSTT